MKSWQEDLLSITDGVQCEHAMFKKIEVAAMSLGFQNCAYVLRIPIPISNPKTVILSNFCSEWQTRYISEGYLKTDPTVLHGCRSQAPLIWNDQLFDVTPHMWDEAQSFGQRVWWVQSSLDALGVGGMLARSRSADTLSATELASKEVKMRWLVNISHLSLSRIYTDKLVKQTQQALTPREIEVLKWTADGKTSSEVSGILAVSEHTVNFHIKNAVAKLKTANKTAAVVRAAMLGLLN